MPLIFHHSLKTYELPFKTKENTLVFYSAWLNAFINGLCCCKFVTEFVVQSLPSEIDLCCWSV